MNESPLITIIIPSYNHEQYIAEAIQSVLDQTYQNWELILIDDVSPDKTYEIAKKVLSGEKRATLIRKSINGGAVDSYNIGITLSKGEYIAFLASDDKWLPEFLKTSVGCAIQNPGSIVFSNAEGINPYFNRSGLISSSQMRKVLLRCNPIVAISCLYPATFMKSIYPLDEKIYLEDYYIRFISVFKGLDYYSTNRCLVKYRSVGDSMSSDEMKMLRGRIQLFLLIGKRLNFRERLWLQWSLSRRTVIAIIKSVVLSGYMLFNSQ